jgi:hypothetical protein
VRKNYSPPPWKRDNYGHLIDAEGNAVVMSGIELAMNWRNDPDAVRIIVNDELATLAPELYEFARDCRDNWDCDADAHRYCTLCRACEAERIVGSRAREESP